MGHQSLKGTIYEIHWGVASLFCSVSNQTLKGGGGGLGNFFPHQMQNGAFHG